MRILSLLTDAFGGRGGIAKFNRDLLAGLCSSRGATSVVAIPRVAPDPIPVLPPKLTYDTAGLSGKLPFALRALRHGATCPRFDRVFCGHINLLPLAKLVGKISGSPITLIIHGIEAWERPARGGVASAVRDMDRVIAVSEFSRNKFCHWSGFDPKRVDILPNCIDLDRFVPSNPRADLIARYQLKNRCVLMTLARLDAGERYKGIDEVLECLPELIGERGELVYLIIGDGDDRSRLETKAASLGLKEHVIFAGRIPEEEKIAHYALADAFVMPGRGEGFGIVYLEAMACGVPVLASTLDGSREAVRNGSLGLMVDPNNRTELLAGLRAVLCRPKGQRPEGLDYFSARAFEQRVHSILSATTPPVVK